MAAAVALVPTGAGVWLATVALGQALRVMACEGTALAFIIVSLLFLGLFLLWLAADRTIGRPAHLC